MQTYSRMSLQLHYWLGSQARGSPVQGESRQTFVMFRVNINSEWTGTHAFSFPKDFLKQLTSWIFLNPFKDLLKWVKDGKRSCLLLPFPTSDFQKFSLYLLTSPRQFYIAGHTCEFEIHKDQIRGSETWPSSSVDLSSFRTLNIYMLRRSTVGLAKRECLILYLSISFLLLHNTRIDI